MAEKQEHVANFGFWFAILGFLFGLLGVVIATLIALAMAKLPLTPENFIQVHLTNPLLWLFDLFPIIMAILMGFLGSRERKYQQVLRQYGAASQHFRTRLQQLNTEQERLNQERSQWEAQMNESQTGLHEAQQILAESEERIQQAEQMVSLGDRQWEVTTDAISDLILIADENEVVVRCNQAVREALKLELPDIVGLPLNELFYGGRPAAGVAPSIEGWQPEGPFPTNASEAVFPNLPGWYQVSSAPMELEQGQLGKIYFLRNVTDRVEGSLDLQRQMQYYQALVKQLPLAVATLKLDQTIVDCNPAFEELFGYTLEEVKGQPLDPLIAPTDDLAPLQALTEAVTQGEFVRQVAQRRCKDGSLVEVEILGVPVTLWGKRIAMMALYHDTAGLDAARLAAAEALAEPAEWAEETPVEPSAEELGEAPEPAVEPVSEAETVTTTPAPAVYKVNRIEGIGAVYSHRLGENGIITTADLLAAGSTRLGRKRLAEKTNISSNLILEWVNRADLMRVPGVGEEFSDLLEASGVDTVKELRNRVPENLYQAMLEVNQAKKLVRRAPHLEEVKAWIAAAKEMDVVVTY
jgi:PAS domain S-box-containing protein